MPSRVYLTPLASGAGTGYMNTAGGRRPGRAPAGHALRIVGLVLSGLALAGCAHPAPPSNALDPIDVSQYAAHPCDLLAPARATRRHLTPPGTVIDDSTSPEPGCRWSSAAPAWPSITATANTDQGLSDLDRKTYAYFQGGGMIDGYPAVQTATNPGGPRGGHCTTRVGVGPHSTVVVSADYPAVTRANAFSADACADAQTMATEIVGSLASGAP